MPPTVEVQTKMVADTFRVAPTIQRRAVVIDSAGIGGVRSRVAELGQAQTGGGVCSHKLLVDAQMRASTLDREVEAALPGHSDRLE